MSGTGSPAAPTAVPEVTPAVTPTPDAPTVITEVDIPADGGFPALDPELPLETPPAPVAAADAPKPDEPKPIKKSPYQARIDTLTAQREAEKKRADEALSQAELYKAMAEGKQAPVDPNAPPAPPAPNPSTYGSKADFDRAVADTAARLAAEEVAKGRTGKLLASGNTEFKDFTERCNVVASLGAGDRPDFMQIMTDPDVISDGHKVIAQLADNPDEAARILALPTVQMTAALVKFQAEHSKQAPPRPLSGAPAPIKPIDGQSKGNDEPSDKDSMAEYARKYQAQQAKRLQEKHPSRFAKH